MAKLEDSRIRQQIEKERKKISSVKKKMEIQKKAEDLGEAWKFIGNQKMKEEMRSVIGDFDTPTVINSVDFNQYFDPIIFYKKDNGEIQQIDYQNYLDTEQAYEDAIKEQDKIIEGIDTEENLQDILKQSKNKEIIKENKKFSKGVSKIYQNISLKFNRFVPKYNKYVCTCCGKPNNINNFLIQYKEINSAFIDEDGNTHMHICKECAKKLYEFLYYEKSNKDGLLAMQNFCGYLNIYFDKDLYLSSKQDMEEDNSKKHIIEYYLKNVNSSDMYRTKNYFDSPNIYQNKDEKEIQINNVDTENNCIGWNKEDKKNRELILKMVGYDPFDYETDENKKMLYKDLLGMLEQGMEYDQVKLQAAIQIVTSFLKVREMNQLYRKKQDEGASVTELKSLSDLKKKELDAITNFSRDNGFSERYATAKAKGENTFTGIINKMNEAKFEKAILNKYDIETSETISQAAEASMKAIFSQLSLGEAEVWKLAQEQLGELQKLRRQNASLQEQLRKANYEIAKMELEEKAKQYEMEEKEY